jgi:hypothetical protein
MDSGIRPAMTSTELDSQTAPTLDQLLDTDYREGSDSRSYPTVYVFCSKANNFGFWTAKVTDLPSYMQKYTTGTYIREIGRTMDFKMKLPGDEERCQYWLFAKCEEGK